MRDLPPRPAPGCSLLHVCPASCCSAPARAVPAFPPGLAWLAPEALPADSPPPTSVWLRGAILVFGGSDPGGHRDRTQEGGGVLQTQAAKGAHTLMTSPPSTFVSFCRFPARSSGFDFHFSSPSRSTAWKETWASVLSLCPADLGQDPAPGPHVQASAPWPPHLSPLSSCPHRWPQHSCRKRSSPGTEIHPSEGAKPSGMAAASLSVQTTASIRSASQVQGLPDMGMKWERSLQLWELPDGLHSLSPTERTGQHAAPWGGLMGEDSK